MGGGEGGVCVCGGCWGPNFVQRGSDPDTTLVSFVFYAFFVLVFRSDDVIMLRLQRRSGEIKK